MQTQLKWNANNCLEVKNFRDALRNCVFLHMKLIFNANFLMGTYVDDLNGSSYAIQRFSLLTHIFIANTTCENALH